MQNQNCVIGGTGSTSGNYDLYGSLVEKSDMI